jgi:membrane protein required for colicin V production
MGTKLIEQALDELLLGWANKVSGGFLYAGFAALLFSLFCWLSAKSGLLSEELKNDSKTFAYIEPIAPKVIAVSSEYLPLCKNLYHDLLDMLSKVGDNVDKNIKKLR